jgi:hypothetical protein
MPIWQPAFPRVVPDRCSTTQPSRHAQCGLQSKEQSCTRRGPANPCLLSSFCIQCAKASVDDHHRHNNNNNNNYYYYYHPHLPPPQRHQPKGTPLVSSLSLAWASALFQMMNPPLCIVTLLSLPGRLPPWLPGTGVLACLRIFRVAGRTW